VTLKVMTIVGTRPEVIKLSCVIAELDKYHNHVLVHTGQNYDFELNQVFFNELGIRRPDYFLNAAMGSTAATIGNIITQSDELMEKVEPDAILIYGDTNSCLSVIAAKRRKIPIFHMEAGNRCFDQRVPEEINRKIVDHLSDINMTITEHARRYLISEGIRAETVIKVGSCMKEILDKHRSQIRNSNILDTLSVSKNNFFVVSIHREENVESDENFKDMMASLNELADRHNQKIIVSTHPRTRNKLEGTPQNNFSPLIEFIKPLGFLDYVALQMSATCTISDSGTITEEASLLRFPAITIRQAHERPEGMDEGTLIMSGLKKSEVISAVEIVTDQLSANEWRPKPVEDYMTDNVSMKVVRIISSYTDYINRTVWRKSR